MFQIGKVSSLRQSHTWNKPVPRYGWLIRSNFQKRLVIAHRSDQELLIAKIGAKEHRRAVIPNLLYQIIGSYEEWGEAGERLYLPTEPVVMPVLSQCFHPLIPGK